ncbi:LOW QUALITY PROTEIN: GRAM domain-containing protein [Cephalotus follicularis]|uniref:GRAM domain-containing protein n=1 Tax=Cephalotus follicularis TaxID=3775 RepID=A0A1Q3CLN2_CEPFO|nr:LOW QUALITY PROTEIN: GRAM domain-containing protein [Cephalotus follicularis]
MKNLPQEHTIGFPTILLSAYLDERPPIYLPAPSNQYNVPPPADGSLTIKLNSILHRMHKLGKKLKKVDNFAHTVREHVRLGPKVTELLTGKLIMGAKILQVGGIEKIFKQSFSVRGGEKLLKVQCYLSITAGPIAGLLFISNDKVAFRSERSIKVSFTNGELLNFHYLIPLTKIEKVNQSENVNNPSQKYIEIVTDDNCDFWFMGFLKYEKF